MGYCVRHMLLCVTCVWCFIVSILFEYLLIFSQLIIHVCEEKNWIASSIE